MTAQGQPRAVFKRAIEHGNLMLAEVTIREIGVVTLGESLSLVAFAAAKATRESDSPSVTTPISRMVTSASMRLPCSIARLKTARGCPCAVIGSVGLSSCWRVVLASAGNAHHCRLSTIG